MHALRGCKQTHTHTHTHSLLETTFSKMVTLNCFVYPTGSWLQRLSWGVTYIAYVCGGWWGGSFNWVNLKIFWLYSMILELDNIPSSNYKGTQRNSIEWKVFIKRAGQVSYLSTEKSILDQDIFFLRGREWESQFLGRLIGSLGVPKERGVWNSQGGRKDKLFFFLHIP